MAPRRSFGLILLAGLLSLAAGELMVRLAAPQAIGLAPPMYLPDSTLAHRLKPRFSGRLRSGEYSTMVVINDRGFRGAAWREDALLRVLVLGDSFTFGYGVEDREAYPAVLEGLLAEAGCRVAVCNAGVPGYGTLQEAALAERLLPDLAPQVVVLGFTVGSDVQDNLQQGIHPDAGYEVRDSFLVQRGTPSGTPLPLKAWMQNHSHAYVLLQRARVRAGVRRTQGSTGRRPCEHFLAESPCGDMPRAWDLTLEAVRRLARACRESDVQLIVLLIPHPVQVDDGLWRREHAAFADTAALDRLLAQRKVGLLCADLGLTCVDPLPAFRIGGRELFYRLDRHMTAAGHGVAAAELAPAVRRLLGCPTHERLDTSGFQVTNSSP